jgi:predicted GH43/DUF377 family glycosyl hydrolase
MSSASFVRRLPILLRPDPARTVIRPYMPSKETYKYVSNDRPRSQRIADRVMALEEEALGLELDRVLRDFSSRHRDISALFLRRFREVEGIAFCECEVSDAQALLIGAHFCHEYSYEAAALFNPSIVRHPDQSDVPAGATRFVLALRGVGEGHISSIAFRTGLCLEDGTVAITPPSPLPVVLETENISPERGEDAGIRIMCDGSHDLSEIVIFPTTASQRGGIEDLRLVQFSHEDGSTSYFGTYTAFSGQHIRQELLATSNFKHFELKPLNGDATQSKGMALFPRCIDGKYAMLGREDNENIWFLTSTDIHEWNGGAMAVDPRWPWEFVQIGNCGSPIEIDEGWLVITHGVGSVRNYCIGACLLDRSDPSKLLARTSQPLLRSDMEEREGYVPNVAYSCGSILHGSRLILPFGVADSFTTFVTMELDQLLAAMS